MKLQYLFLSFLLCTMLMSACGDNKTDTTQTAKPIENAVATPATVAVEYSCPMNCEKDKVYAEVGKCPVCKMDLALKGEKTATDEAKEHGHSHDKDGDHKH